MDLTPEAQVVLSQRLADLLEQWGPVLAITVLVLIVYRKEIGALILSMRRDGTADAMLGQMNSSFSQNLQYFQRAVTEAEKIRAATEATAATAKEALTVAQSIKDEMIRRGR